MFHLWLPGKKKKINQEQENTPHTDSTNDHENQTPVARTKKRMFNNHN